MHACMQPESLTNESRQAPLVLFDEDVVRAHVPPAHVSTVIELPVLVSVRAVPLPVVVVPFVFEAGADTISLFFTGRGARESAGGR